MLSLPGAGGEGFRPFCFRQEKSDLDTTDGKRGSSVVWGWELG